MNKRTLLNLTVSQLKKVFEANLSWLVMIANQSPDKTMFLEQLRLYLENYHSPASKRILLMMEYEDKSVHELSRGEAVQVESFTYLWQFLTENFDSSILIDIYLDFYYLFEQLDDSDVTFPDKTHLKHWMKRWSTGLDGEVIEIRNRNKQRIMNLLVKKIERRSTLSSKYVFPEGFSANEKLEKVKEWWSESRFHLAMAIKNPIDLNLFLGNTLSEETMKLLSEARIKGMPFFVTPYYLSLLNIEKQGFDDETVRTYIMYSQNLVNTYGTIRAWEKEDVVETGKPNAAGWLLPEGHNIHRRYPEVAILIPDSMGRACGGLCASCQRMYDFQSERLNFDFEALKPKETWDKKLRRLMQYFEDDTQLRDILITGGDAFMSQNKTLRNILEAVYKMALRKKRANESRSEGQKYAELQRVRLGTRLLAYLPLRVNEELISILKEFKQKASEIGVKHFIIQTHFQSPLEVTPEAREAVRAILSAGWLVTNQLVFTVAASRRGHTAELRQLLNSIGVIGYYTFSVKGFEENYSMFAPNSRSLQEANEEKSFGLISPAKEEELLALVRDEKNLVSKMSRFQRDNHLPFVATDRNVLNLPAIGKSMTFATVGITAEGKRILKFKHDTGRKHSPIIDRMGEVYIIENKSIAAYLRQLDLMGEDINDYKSIWHYSEGVTESRFRVYEYPEFNFEVTSEMTNLQID